MSNRSDISASGRVPGPLRAVGRLLLWGALTLVFVRGFGGVLAGPPDRGSSGTRGALEFPTDDARAFAVRFARLYVAGPSRRALRSYMASDLSDQAAVDGRPRSPGAQVAWAMVARESSLGSSRALVTVAVVLADGRTRYVTVPVGQDEHGGLAVFDLPAFTAPPPLADLPGPSSAPITAADADAIADVVRRFLRAYVAGARSSDLAYYVAPGAGLTAMPAGLRVEAVDQLDQAGDEQGGDRTVLAEVRARDPIARRSYRLRYRLRLVRRDRWYVADVEGGPRA